LHHSATTTTIFLVALLLTAQRRSFSRSAIHRRYLGQNASAAAALAATVDAVVFVAAFPTAEPNPGCEGADRLTLALPPWQDAMIAAVAAANPRVVVVTRTGGAALMPWLANVPTVLHTGLAGQEAGNALADILLGAENPSGKLTITFPAADNATWLTTTEQYPGVFNSSGDGFWQTNYTEGLFVGWRFYAAVAAGRIDAPVTTKPLFQFGHGKKPNCRARARTMYRLLPTPHALLRLLD
jgi:beta-glucosidase